MQESHAPSVEDNGSEVGSAQVPARTCIGPPVLRRFDALSNVHEPPGLPPPQHSAVAGGRLSTRDLLERYRKGQASALELVFQREIPLLRRWARGRLPRWARAAVDTADLVQDALVRSLPHLSRFEVRREKALQAYLRTAVANQLRDELRRIARKPTDPLLEDGEGLVADGQLPDAVLIESEDRERYARALAQLSETDRAAVVARLQLEYSYDQIALLLGKRSANAARMTVTRAIVRLIGGMADDPPKGDGGS